MACRAIASAAWVSNPTSPGAAKARHSGPGAWQPPLCGRASHRSPYGLSDPRPRRPAPLGASYDDAPESAPSNDAEDEVEYYVPEAARDDDVLPDSLEDALATAASATSQALDQGIQKAMVRGEGCVHVTVHGRGKRQPACLSGVFWREEAFALCHLPFPT